MVITDILAVILGLAGIAGCILPALPGPPLSWTGLLLLYFWGGTNGKGDDMSLTILLVMLGLTVIVSILDYVIPAKLTKVTGGSSASARGAMAGLLIGIVFTPIGMLLGTFLGALLAEAHYTDFSRFRDIPGDYVGNRPENDSLDCDICLYHHLPLDRPRRNTVFGEPRIKEVSG